MTQFLLSAAPDPQLESGYEATPLAIADSLVAPAAAIFPSAATVWKIQPSSEEMDVAVDCARDEVLLGAPIEETELGRLLTLLAAQGDFALFWAGEYEDLPTVSRLEDLWAVIEPQIRTHAANWELYARFLSAGANGTPRSG